MPRALPLSAGLAVVILAGLAMLRPVDHDESQYVAAALLAWRGLPYRDFAYLQTPLQPLLFAPVAALAGSTTYPALRLANALLGVVTLVACYRAAREAGVAPRTALLSVALLAASDIFLFSVGVARNDALPAALLAVALVPMLRAAYGRGSAAGALLIGLLLSSAAAAKVSYALPALAYGVCALVDRRHRPGGVLAGAVPMTALVAALAAAALTAFWFDVFTFPARAPAQWYLASGRPDKLSTATKLVDILKFLALGPALVLAMIWLRDRRRRMVPVMLDVMIVAGLVAAILPQPTWRQYLLPMLVPLAVRVAIAWQARPPGSAMRVALCIFAAAGVAPSVEAVIRSFHGGIPMVRAVRDSIAIADALDSGGVTGPVASLSPQFLAGARQPIDRRFAAGPFYFRSTGLLDDQAERTAMLVSTGRLDQRFRADPPAAILVGGEARWSSGSDVIDRVVERHALDHHWQRLPLRSDRFRLYRAPPRQLVDLSTPKPPSPRRY